VAIRILIVGKAQREPLIEAADAYLDKVRRHLRIDVVHLDPGRRARKVDDVRLRALEAESLNRAAKGAKIIALDATGKNLDSLQFAHRLERWIGAGDLAFAIGGATGLHPDFVRQADFTLSLGAMTLPHRLARLVLSEQLYRAFSILKGEPYHK